MRTLVLITNIPNPYRIPLFNELNSQLKADGIELVVIFAAETYARRKSIVNMDDCQFNYHILHSEAIHGKDPEKTTFSYKGLYTLLRKIQPWRIIVSGFSAASLQVWWYGLRHRCPYLIWSGSMERPGYSESIIRRRQRKFLIRSAHGFIVYGSAAREYLIRRGAKPNKIYTAINTVDTHFFDIESSRHRLTEMHPGLPLTLLYIGYLVPRKNVSRLIELAIELKKVNLNFRLILVGDGSDSALLKKLCLLHDLNDRVQFEGFRQKSDLPQFLARADLFLFQTDFDIWGLSLNEAMAAGICCLASTHAGATRDLIQPEHTGYPVNFTKTKEVAELISALERDRPKIMNIGKAAAGFIRNQVNLSVSAKGFVDALKDR